MLKFYLVMEEYPYDRDLFFVQEHDFSSSIDDILKEIHKVPFDSRDVIHHESSCMDDDQSYIQSFADDLAFSHADGSSIQPRLPKVDETATSRKPATTLACAWPD